MADAPVKGKIGQGTARQDTIDSLTKKREKLEAEKRKSFFREQIIFFVLAIISVAPLVAAFMSKDNELSYLLFKVGGATLILLYPTYLLIRAVISSALKSKKTA